MEKTLFKFIWRYSKRDQIILLVLTAISFPFLYLSLDLPKTIINKAIGGKDVPEEEGTRENQTKRPPVFAGRSRHRKQGIREGLPHSGIKEPLSA